MDRDFWKGKRVLVTGHTGFKGSWFSLWLQSAGAQVIGYSLEPPTTPSLFEDAHIAEGMTSIIGNVQDFDTLRQTLRKTTPEVVIHMAAQSLVMRSYTEPRETYATNIMGTVNLMEAVREAGGVKVVINVTTDKCYENREWQWGYRENDRLGGRDPYSSSKACSEIVTAAYRESFLAPAKYATHGTAVATARAGNVIGGGDWSPDRLMSDLIRAAEAKKTVKIRRPNAIRPWQHVLDALNGYAALAERMWQDGSNFSEAWNFGPDDAEAKPVSWVVEQISSLWPGGVKWELDDSQQPHEANQLRLDCSKARTRLGYRPALELAKALAWVVEWHQKRASGQTARAITQEQIARYQDLDLNAH